MCRYVAMVGNRMTPDYTAWAALWNALLAGEHAQSPSREAAALAAIEECLRVLAAQVQSTEKGVTAVSAQAAEYWKTWADFSARAGAGVCLNKAQAGAQWAQLLMSALLDAATQYATKQPVAAGASLRASFDTWVSAMEAAYQTTVRSAPFIDAQTRLLNGLIDERIALHSMMERVAESLGMPTRSEVDALHDALRRSELRTTTAPSATGPIKRLVPAKKLTTKLTKKQPSRQQTLRPLAKQRVR